MFIEHNGLRWRDAPKDYGPHKTLYNRWSDKGASTKDYGQNLPQCDVVDLKASLADENSGPTSRAPKWRGSSFDVAEKSSSAFPSSCRR
jgi:hypothetical protein